MLLTRSPLEYPQQAAGLSVRLACVKHAASVRPEPGSNSPQKNFSTKAKKSGREKPKPNKKTNQPKTNTIENTTTLILNKAGKSKNYYTKKNHNHPQPDGAKKGGSQTTKNDSRNLNAYQTNKLNYLQSRPKRPDPAHTTPTKHPA
ncbi:TPA: hypothetical protein I8V48_002454 [Corynebacterium striatum]|nr:hypothetical protein [Corynebacterium striatum]